MFILPFPNAIVLGQDLVIPGPVGDSPEGQPETVIPGKPILPFSLDAEVIFAPADPGRIVVPARTGFVPVRRAAMRPLPGGSLAARQRGGGGLAPSSEGVMSAAGGRVIDAGGKGAILRAGNQETLRPARNGIQAPSSDSADLDTEGEC